MILSFPELIEPGQAKQIADRQDPEFAKSVLADALMAKDRFLQSVLPLKIGAAEVLEFGPERPFSESRAIIGARDGPMVRGDVEIVAFLSAPDTYDGGEFQLDTGYGPVARKLAAGSCLVYPMASRTDLSPVTQGQCLLVRMQVQSCVRRAEQRRIVYDISKAADYYELTGMADAVATLRRCQNRLLGLWAET